MLYSKANKGFTFILKWLSWKPQPWMNTAEVKLSKPGGPISPHEQLLGKPGGPISPHESQGDQFHLMNSCWVRSWAFFVPIQLMQKVQNTAACLIRRAPRHQNCTPLLQQLHWLPVSERIKYNTACMCYNAITGSTPFDLSELLHFYSPSCSLRSSSDTRMLKIQRFNRKTHGFHTFSHFGPHFWNNIPQDIRHSATLSSFKSQLKTFLFSEYFS